MWKYWQNYALLHFIKIALHTLYRLKCTTTFQCRGWCISVPLPQRHSMGPTVDREWYLPTSNQRWADPLPYLSIWNALCEMVLLQPPCPPPKPASTVPQPPRLLLPSSKTGSGCNLLILFGKNVLSEGLNCLNSSMIGPYSTTMTKLSGFSKTTWPSV